MVYTLIYNIIFIPLLKLLLPFICLFIPKLRERSRKAVPVFDSIPFQKPIAGRVFWFHAASMGEFEQAKPVIELIKTKEPDAKIICTFFSPSGYNNQQNYSMADAVLYILLDTKKNADKFLDKFKPDAAVFVRYDLWLNHLNECKKRDIKLFLIAATKPGSIAASSFEITKQFYALLYSKFDMIFTVGIEHTKSIQSISPDSNIISSHDPRFDRIYSAVSRHRNNPPIPRTIFGNELIIVAGSTWNEDANILIPAIVNANRDGFQYRCIFVPHEPTNTNIEYIQSKIASIRLSEIENAMRLDTIDDLKAKLASSHIIVDSIGKLLGLYALADAAYIGGGFGAGVHSIAEPAGYGIPLSCGPKSSKSADANQLIRLESLMIIKSDKDAYKWLVSIANHDFAKTQAEKNAKYISEKLGASELIVDEINKCFWK